jgi:hypothetical protein
VGFADLDVKAVHAVVGDLERIDTRLALFLGFEIDQELVGIGGEIAQLVELGIEALADYAAVANQHRRILDDRRVEQRDDLGMRADVFGQPADQRAVERLEFALQAGQGLQCRRQCRQVARPRR